MGNLKRFFGFLPGVTSRECEFFVVDEDPDRLGYFMRKHNPKLETVDDLLDHLERKGYL